MSRVVLDRDVTSLRIIPVMVLADAEFLERPAGDPRIGLV